MLNKEGEKAHHCHAPSISSVDRDFIQRGLGESNFKDAGFMNDKQTSRNQFIICSITEQLFSPIFLVHLRKMQRWRLQFMKNGLGKDICSTIQWLDEPS